MGQIVESRVKRAARAGLRKSTLSVNPAGVETGTRIRLAGEEARQRGGPG